MQRGENSLLDSSSAFRRNMIGILELREEHIEVILTDCRISAEMNDIQSSHKGDIDDV